MIDRIKIIIRPDTAEARFNTRLENAGADTGRRCEHFVYPNEQKTKYWHERHYLTSRKRKPVENSFTEFVSKRKFFKKYRLVMERQVCLPETWMAIGQAVAELEQLKDRKKPEKNSGIQA